MTSPLDAFAEEVGVDGPVCVAGGRTQWSLGGYPADGCREVRAPAGVVSHVPAEMTVRVGAGTVVAELAATLAKAGQMVPLDPADPEHATVGGVLVAGQSGLRRLRFGPLRDAVLEVRFVTAEGVLVKAGGPVVKNVSGFDLCRLLVGSLGTLGLVAETVLRVQPAPAVSRWFWAEEADPVEMYKTLYRPSSILWDGRSVWVLLEGHAGDVADQASRVLGPSFVEVDGPPDLPEDRISMAPGERPAAVGLGEGWVLEIGVGTVHVGGMSGRPEGRVAERRVPERRVAELNRALKGRFDPRGRLNPGRVVP